MQTYNVKSTNNILQMFNDITNISPQLYRLIHKDMSHMQVSGCCAPIPFPRFDNFVSVCRESGAFECLGGLPNVTKAEATAKPAG